MLPLLLPLRGGFESRHACERSLLVERLSVRLLVEPRCSSFVVVVRRSSVDSLKRGRCEAGIVDGRETP